MGEHGAARASKRRDQQIAVLKMIGLRVSDIASIGHVWCDEEIRTTLTEVRSTLSVAQSKVRAKIDEPIVKGQQNEDLLHRGRN